MSRTSTVRITLALLLATASAHASVVRVYADARRNVHVVTMARSDDSRLHRRSQIVPRQPGQVGIDSVTIAADRETAGWLVLYANPDAGAPIAGRLMVWRDGRVVRTFSVSQTFWSWSFENAGKQVAYHVGPLHGEQASHCELHDVESGRLLQSWDGNLADPTSPAWTKQLNH
jgi:hypothetical protein